MPGVNPFFTSTVAPSVGDVLVWNGTEWYPTPGGGGGGGPVTGDLSGTVPGVITVVGIQGRGVVSTAPTTGQGLLWNGTNWAPTTIGTGGPPSGPASGDLGGVYPSPTVVALQGHAVNNTAPLSGQVFEYVSGPNEWFPASAVGDVTGPYSGLVVGGLQGNPVSATAPTTGYALTWNGSAWAPAPSGGGSGSGDLSGTYPGPMTVTGLQGHPVASTAPTLNYVLEWTGSNWAPEALPSSLPPSGSAGGDLTGSYPNPTVDGLQGNPVASTAPTLGYVLTWNGSAWAPALAGSGPPSGPAGGDLSGSYPNPTVSGLQGHPMVSTTPASGQVVEWTGSAWTPTYLPAAPPVISSMISVGHSYLGSVNLSTDEPMTQATTLMPRLLGMFHVPEQNLLELVTSGGRIIGNAGPTAASWDTVWQKIMPPQATGLAATANLPISAGTAVQSKVLTGSLPMVFPSCGQPSAVVLIGVNDMQLLQYPNTPVPPPPSGSLYTQAGFTAAMTSGSATLTVSGSNLTPGNAFLGGRGILPGDFIQSGGALIGLNGAIVQSVSYSSPNTTITLQSGTSVIATGSFSCAVQCGQFGAMQTAFTGAYSAIINRLIAGSVVRSDDTSSSLQAYFTYTNGSGGGGSWTTPSQYDNTFGWLGHSGPTIATVTTTSAASTPPSFTLTVPRYFPGGVVGIEMVGTSDEDYTNSIISFSGTSGATGNYQISSQGACGFTAPVIVRFVIPATTSAVTIVGTFSCTGSGTAQLQVNGATVDATYMAPVVLGNQPPGGVISNDINSTVIDFSISQAVSNFNQTNAGAGYTQCGVFNNYTGIVKADLWGAIRQRSFYLGSNLPSAAQNAITTGVTLIGRNVTGQVAPFVNQWVSMTNPLTGGQNEIMLVTAVAAGSNVTIAGSSYPTWTVSLKRAAVIYGYQSGLAANAAVCHYTGVGGISLPGLGSNFTLAVTADAGTTIPTSGTMELPTTTLASGGVPTWCVITYTGFSGGNLTGCNILAGGGYIQTNAILSLTSGINDESWMGPDFVHPGFAGAPLFASVFFNAFNSAFNTNAAWEAAANQSWVAKRTRTNPRPLWNGYWTNRGLTPASGGLTNAFGGAGAGGNVYAIRMPLNETTIVKEICVGVHTASTINQMAYAGIAIPASSGSYPGLLVTDFGLTGVNLNGAGTGWITIASGFQVLPPGEYWILFGTATGGTGQAVFSAYIRSHGDLNYHMDIAQAMGYVNSGSVGGWPGTAPPQSANLPGTTAASTAGGLTGWAATYPAANINTVPSPNTLYNLMPSNSTGQNAYGEGAGYQFYGFVGMWTPQTQAPMIAVHTLGHMYNSLP